MSINVKLLMEQFDYLAEESSWEAGKYRPDDERHKFLKWKAEVFQNIAATLHDHVFRAEETK